MRDVVWLVKGSTAEVREVLSIVAGYAKLFSYGDMTFDELNEHEQACSCGEDWRGES